MAPRLPGGVAGQLHVTAVGAVDAFDEEHGNALAPGQIQGAGTGGHGGLGPLDAVAAPVVDKTVFHVDEEERGTGGVGFHMVSPFKAHSFSNTWTRKEIRTSSRSRAARRSAPALGVFQA